MTRTQGDDLALDVRRVILDFVGDVHVPMNAPDRPMRWAAAADVYQQPANRLCALPGKGCAAIYTDPR